MDLYRNTGSYPRPGTIAVIVLAAVVCLLPLRPVEAQVNLPGESDGIDTVLVIDSITWDIDGRTRRWVLRNLLDLEPGMVFSSEGDLVVFLLDQQQILVNQRELDTSRIEYTVEETEDPREQRVHVQISVKDTWNIIALPYARYDSNEGLLLSIRARDYNFFGTLQDLRIDLDYEYTDEEESVVTLSTNFSLPFEMLQREWAFTMKQTLEFLNEEIDFEIGLGIEHYFEWIGLDWTAAVEQRYRFLSDDKYGDGYYLGNRFTLGSGVSLPASLPYFGPLRYSPEVYSSIDYKPGGISEERQGLTVGFDHRITAGRFNWLGNYRDGQTFMVGNDNEYNLQMEEWDTELSLEISVFRALLQADAEAWPKAGVSGRIISYYLVHGASETQSNAARYARGILNDRMNGDLGVFLNTDVSFTVWTLRPLFEMQVGTFLDVAYVADTRGDFYESTSFDRERDLKFGTGVAVIGFPLFARSLFVRGSYGVDLDLVRDGVSPLDSKAREIFIGLGHFY